MSFCISSKLSGGAGAGAGGPQDQEIEGKQSKSEARGPAPAIPRTYHVTLGKSFSLLKLSLLHNKRIW